MTDRIRALLAHALGPDLPELVERLVCADHRPEDFDVGVVLSSTGRHRAYIADRADPTGWDRTVRRHLPGAARLLDAAPPGVRRMVDTDGTFAEVYLDDLQRHRPDLGLMCLVWSRASDQLSRVRLADSIPPGFSAFSKLSERGKLALRTGGGVQHLLWVTEARWTGDVAEVRALAAQVVPLPPSFVALEVAMSGVYIDALDLHANGRVDVTAGILPANPAR